MPATSAAACQYRAAHAAVFAAAVLAHRVTNTRQAWSCAKIMRTGGAACIRANQRQRAAQARRNTNVPLVPPKPKLFLTAKSIFICRAVLAQ